MNLVGDYLEAWNLKMQVCDFFGKQEKLEKKRKTFCITQTENNYDLYFKFLY